MPPKRKSSVNLGGSDAEAPRADTPIHEPEDEGAPPKKRGRRSMIDAILQEEGMAAPWCGLLPDI